MPRVEEKEKTTENESTIAGEVKWENKSSNLKWLLPHELGTEHARKSRKLRGKSWEDSYTIMFKASFLTTAQRHKQPKRPL